MTTIAEEEIINHSVVNDYSWHNDAYCYLKLDWEECSIQLTLHQVFFKYLEIISKEVKIEENCSIK